MVMRRRRIIWTAVAVCAGVAAYGQGGGAKAAWQEEFDLSSCNLQTTGRSQYFVLEPGFRLTLEGGDTRLEITVLEETKKVDGVVTRVVEEREWKDGKLYEIARNYLAMCQETKDVFYFGEDVDFYKDGRVVNHEGSWLAGTKGSRPGLIMPGSPKVKMKYYQEIAPGVAMDRAEIISVNETCKTPAGTFAGCLKVKEGSAIEMFATEYKYHAPGIGFVGEEDVRLIKYGVIEGKGGR